MRKPRLLAVRNVDAYRAQIEDVTNNTALEEYWEKYKLRPENRSEQQHDGAADYFHTDPSANGYRKSRAMSTATAYLPSHHTLAPHHPALTLLDSADLFGPLLFPLYRAALLRKRILIVADTPVQSSCNLGKPAAVCVFMMTDE